MSQDKVAQGGMRGEDSGDGAQKKNARQIRVDYGQLFCVNLQEIRYQENRNLDHECQRGTQVQQACRAHDTDRHVAAQ